MGVKLLEIHCSHQAHQLLWFLGWVFGVCVYFVRKFCDLKQTPKVIVLELTALLTGLPSKRKF